MIDRTSVTDDSLGVEIRRAWNFPSEPAFRLLVDGIPLSKKNSQRILKTRAGRRFVKQSAESEIFERRLKALARGVIAREGLGDHYVAVRIVIDEQREKTAIEIYDLGPQPARGRKDTRRDIHNCADSVMDALNNIAWNDDRQARIVVCEYGRVVVNE